MSVVNGLLSWRKLSGNWFRLYSFGTLLAFLVLTIVGIWIAPRMAAGEPVSRVGIQERVMSYACLLWVGLLAIALLRRGSADRQPGN